VRERLEYATVDLFSWIDRDSLDRARHSEPVRLGIPLPLGLCDSIEQLALFDGQRQRLPLQAAVLDRWKNGSLRWVLIDFQASAHQPLSKFSLDIGRDQQASPFTPGIAVNEQYGEMTVNTGAARFVLRTGHACWFASVVRDGRTMIDPSRSGLEVTDADGRKLATTVTGIRCEEVGPLRVVVSVDGAISRPGRRTLLLFRARVHFFAGMSTVRHEVTIHNPRRAAHPGGFWELGDPGSVLLGDASLVFAVPTDEQLTGITCWAGVGDLPLTCKSRVRLYQDSSGCSHWQSTNHVTGSGQIPLRFRGFRVHADEYEATGLHATPTLSLQHSGGVISVAMQYFWQNFPKSVEADARGIRLGLFPQSGIHPHELQGGEQKTHACVMAFGPDTVTETPLDWCRRPARVRADPRWYCSTQVVKYLIPAAEDPHPDYVALVQQAIEGDHSFEHKRTIIDEYGWRNFGDLYADHEAAFQSSGEPPLVSHYNNQYDSVAGCAYQFMRSGDWRWWTAMDELAAHVVDIDIYHTQQDKAAYNNGLFWHTDHYQDAGKATHRTFPKRDRVRGGGPSPEHNYTSGLLLHYWLTGDRGSRNAVIDLAQWVIAMDDGRRTPLWWLDSGRTGLVSVIGSIRDHGPGRGPGNSLNALVDAHRLTGDRVYLEKAEELIRRCIHPADDVNGRDLLDAERRWFYTVFLQALGKYLDWKIELRELDDTYAYARASLLTYARWMAQHERPYLSHPDKLEYPTETWAAQDMRKSEIFKLASLHGPSSERTLFLERSQFFFDYSVQTLRQMPTGTLTRPLVLLLSNGWMHAYFQRNRDATAPVPVTPVIDFGMPEAFLPQRIRAAHRAAWIAVCGLVVALAMVVAIW